MGPRRSTRDGWEVVGSNAARVWHDAQWCEVSLAFSTYSEVNTDQLSLQHPPSPNTPLSLLHRPTPARSCLRDGARRADRAASPPRDRPHRARLLRRRARAVRADISVGAGGPCKSSLHQCCGSKGFIDLTRFIPFQITPTQFLESINAINELLILAHSTRHAFVDNTLAVLTLQLSRLFVQSYYDRVRLA